MIKKYIHKIVNEAEHYAEAKFEETRLDTVDKSISILTGVLSWLVIVAVALLLLTSLSFVALLALAKLTGGYISAGLIVGGFYLIIFFFLLAFHERILGKPIKNFLLGEYLQNYKEK